MTSMLVKSCCVKTRRVKACCRISCASVLVLAFGCSLDRPASSQTADVQWAPSVSHPEFPEQDGPIVLVDSAHGNFHTLDGRFAAFGQLLSLDGYQVRSADVAVSRDLLESAQVFVISNALYGGADAQWTLPTPPAFTAAEVELIVEWVEQGGSLLLIADHMPFPGGTEDLAREFGIVFLNGFAMQSTTDRALLSFTRSGELLADHSISRGRFEHERIESVVTFTGQAFRYVAAVSPLLHMPDDWQVYLPGEAWEFDTRTPTVSTAGLIQGGVLRYGKGRLAVFGEAAMFTAQTAVKDGIAKQMGLNHPEATDNAQFVLNVMHWLTGQLDGW